LYALSFVDERYIAEAETVKVGRKIPWMKVLSVAACLCILMAGAFAMTQMGYKGVTEEAAAPSAPAETLAEAPEAAPPMQDEMMEESAAEPVTIPGELHHVPFAHLRILEVREDGSFAVFVERVADEPGPFGAGEEMILVIDPKMIPETDRTDLPYDGDITADMLVEIQNGVYDAGINTLYAEGVAAAARE
jgi:hypothetical protein